MKRPPTELHFKGMGLEAVHIDDNARGDVSKDYHGRTPEPDGLFNLRTVPGRSIKSSRGI